MLHLTQPIAVGHRRSADLEAAHRQVVLVAGVPREAEHCEGDGGGGQAGQRQLPFAGVRLLEESRQLQHCDLEGERERETEVEVEREIKAVEPLVRGY